jgi:simple sugar transport system substrate-binding protein
MKVNRILVLLLVAVVALPVFAGGSREAAGDTYEIVMVAKHEGISWFDDMRVGVEEFGAEFADVEAYQIAPEGGDPARQVQMVEDLIAKGVDAILVVPNDPVAMMPVLERAKAAGIVVVSHEAEQLAGIVDWNMEAFRNEEFGKLMFESLAKYMDYEGDFVGMVGALTMQTHMQWFQSGLDWVTAQYPKMNFILDEPVEDFNTEQTAYNRALELLRTYPNIKGMFGCSASSTIMMAQAVEERGLQDQVAVVGLTLPSMSSAYLASGALEQAQCWRPADAGYVSAMIAYRLLKGEPIQNGVDLGRPGYENIVVSNGTVYGNAPLVLTAENVGNYSF